VENDRPRLFGSREASMRPKRRSQSGKGERSRIQSFGSIRRFVNSAGISLRMRLSRLRCIAARSVCPSFGGNEGGHGSWRGPSVPERCPPGGALEHPSRRADLSFRAARWRAPSIWPPSDRLSTPRPRPAPKRVPLRLASPERPGCSQCAQTKCEVRSRVARVDAAWPFRARASRPRRAFAAKSVFHQSWLGDWASCSKA
jgi:hypothetical protein